LGRHNWTSAGSLRGADRAAIMLTMITTCRLNDFDPKAWLADILARIADLPASRLHELLPWNGTPAPSRQPRRSASRLTFTHRHHGTRRAGAHASIRRFSSYAYDVRMRDK
jgi:hypothetical protein